MPELVHYLADERPGVATLVLDSQHNRNALSKQLVTELYDGLARGEADVTFLMNPVRMQDVRDVAFAGEVMPQKSTDFYPKMLSGLTIYSLDAAAKGTAGGK